MGNSGSVSLYTEGSNRTEGSHGTAKSSFRSVIFKHRRSIRSGLTKREATVNAGVAEAGLLVPADGSVQPDGSAAATGPMDIVVPSALTVELTVPSAGGAVMPSSSLEPTYEEIRQGSLSTSYGEAMHHSVSPSAAAGGGTAIAAVVSTHGRSASCDGAGGTSVAAVSGHDTLPSDKAAHGSAATGSGAKSLLAKLALGSGKKSKKGKRRSKVEEASKRAPAAPGEGDAAGLDSCEAKRGSRSRTSGDKENLMVSPAAGAAAGVVSGGGHSRAASFDRQLPDIPRAKVSSDETIPKARYCVDMSPKQRRALPDIPHGSPPAPDDPCDDQIYSAVASPAVQQTTLDSGATEPDDSFYDTLQRDENPASVKIRQLKLSNGDNYDDQYSKAVETPLDTDAVTAGDQAYSAANKQPVQQAVKPGVATPDDGCYDMLQRDANPASVKTKQLKLQHAAAGSGGEAEDQYSKAVELPLVPAAVAESSVESESAYYEALVEPPVLDSHGALSAPALLPLTQPPAPQQQPQVRSSTGVLRRARAGGAPPGVYEQVELEAKSASVKGSSGREFDTPVVMSPQGTARPVSWDACSAGAKHGLAPYSAVRPVSVSGRLRNLGAPIPTSSSVCGTSRDAEPPMPPPVPDKLFGISDELTACLALPAAVPTPSSAVPLVVAGQVDGSSFTVLAGALANDADENEVYSEPVESEATAGALYMPRGDLPANYDILTVRPPLSALKERLALADSQATEEENDYYETVDKADVPLPESAALKPVGGSHSSSCSPEAPSAVENEAGDVYAVPNEVENITPPKHVRQKVKSGYEEVVLPDTAAMGASEPTARGSVRLVPCNGTAVEAHLKPDAAGQTGSAITTVAQNDSTGQRHSKSARRYGYELVDLPGTVGGNPRVLIGGPAGHTVAVDGNGGGMVIPPSPADRPLALPLAARTRLPHHYDDIDDRLSDQASRPMPSAQPARHQHHHYDEIDEVRKDEA